MEREKEYVIHILGVLKRNSGAAGAGGGGGSVLFNGWLGSSFVAEGAIFCSDHRGK